MPSILGSSQAQFGHASMKRRGSLMTSAGMICSVLLLAFVLLTIQVRAQSVLDAKCTGEPDVPWSEQIAGCTRAIESGKYAGKDLVKALIFRGKAYGQTGDIDRCLGDIEQAIRLDPTDAFAFGARGDVHLVRKDYERALADYTKAASLDPNNALVFIGRGMVYIATSDLDRAMADFEQAIRLQPTLAAGLYWRGIAKRLKGDTAAGEADIAAAKKIDPEVDH
jgi:tetratricopeptide (TPR) repeat protein